jgi:alkylhydroperoxidase family enzyme
MTFFLRRVGNRQHRDAGVTCARSVVLAALVWLLMAMPGLASESHCDDSAGASDSSTARQKTQRFPVLDHGEAWKRLPKALSGGGQPLPVWARALAATLPYTAAAMLELDFLHRARTPISQKLRGQMRWVAAHANRCAYSEAYAAADLRRLGYDDAAIRALGGDLKDFLVSEREALVFARKLSVSADTVTDGEVARLIERYGARQMVAMVLLLAHSSFQDRLLLALDLPVEAGGPLQPVEIRFAHRPVPALRPPLPASEPEGLASSAGADWIIDGQWQAPGSVDLQGELERQRGRQPRIQLSTTNGGQINWGNVCLTYQPEMANAWTACTRAFAVEANQDPVFEETVFWVITRTLRCFY